MDSSNDKVEQPFVLIGTDLLENLLPMRCVNMTFHWNMQCLLVCEIGHHSASTVANGQTSQFCHVCRHRACQQDLRECLETSDAADCLPVSQIGNVTLSVRLACIYANTDGFGGMSWWRWCLFAALFWPLLGLAYVLANILTAAIRFMRIDGSVRALFATLSCKPPLLLCVLRVVCAGHVCIKPV